MLDPIHRYVISGGAGGHTGVDEANAWDLEEGLANATEGMYVWIKAGTYEAGGEIPISDPSLSVGGTGDITKNRHIHFIGYKATVVEGSLLSDMDYGQTYYGGALDAFKAANGYPVDNASAEWVIFNGLGAITGPLMTINGKDNIHFHNIFFTRTDQSVPASLIKFVTSPAGITLVNCKFDDGYAATTGTAYDVSILDCYFNDNFTSPYIVRGWVAILLHVKGCVFDIGAGKVGLAPTYSVIEDTIFWGGEKGIQTYYHSIVVRNCLFYKQTLTGIWVYQNNSVLTEYNNIFAFSYSSDYAVLINYAGGSTVQYSDYSLSWAISAVEGGDTPWWHDFDNKDFTGPNAQTDVDPKFVNRSQGDFRLLPGSPCLNTGRPDAFDQPTTIGPSYKRQSARPLRGLAYV